MNSLRFLERGKSRKEMEATKVRRKSSYPMGMAKCMRVRRTRIHNWSRISKHVDDQCERLIRSMRRYIRNRRGKLRYQGRCSNIEVGDSSGKRSGRGSIEEIGETRT